MLQTCPNHLSKSPCELRFSRLLLPESHAQCVLIHTGTPDSQVNFGQKGCISKTVVDKGAFIRGPIRGLYEVSLYGLCRSSPWASEARLLHLSWQQQRRRKQQQQEEAAAGAGSSSRQQQAEGSRQYTMENKHVPNHQPDNHNYEDCSNMYLFCIL